MDNNNNKPHNNKQPLHVSSESLLRELDTLRDAVISLSAEHKQGPKLLAIVRLLSGFDRKDWTELAEKFNLGQWLALDLNSSSTQNLSALYEEIQDLAFQKDHDPLTSLPNRRMFLRNLEVEIQRRERYNADLSVASIDLDFFKKVNDAYGHAVGDEVLKRLGAHLLSSKRPYDTAARMGGEEFALLLPGASSMRANAIVQRILNEFREIPFNAPNGEVFYVTFSAGITSIKDGISHDLEKILEAADKAMYKAKNSGRNRIVSTLLSNEELEKKSMVQSNEKHFLFTGAHKQSSKKPGTNEN